MTKKIIIGIIAIVAFGVAYWLISPLFIDKVVSEGLPTSTGYDLPADAVTPEPITLATGTFTGVDSVHQGSGTVKVIRVGRQNYLRFEDDFSVTNGPDLFVYLGKEGEVHPALRLGELKGSKGSQNYVIPIDASILDTNQVIIWCRAFNVNFSIANLTLKVPVEEYLKGE